MCGKENTLLQILSRKDFQKCSSEEIKELQYATIECSLQTKWTALVEFIFGTNGVQAEFVFLDAWCTNHTSREHADRRKVMESD